MSGGLDFLAGITGQQLEDRLDHLGYNPYPTDLTKTEGSCYRPLEAMPSNAAQWDQQVQQGLMHHGQRKSVVSGSNPFKQAQAIAPSNYLSGPQPSSGHRNHCRFPPIQSQVLQQILRRLNRAGHNPNLNQLTESQALELLRHSATPAEHAAMYQEHLRSAPPAQPLPAPAPARTAVLAQAAIREPEGYRNLKSPNRLPDGSVVSTHYDPSDRNPGHVRDKTRKSCYICRHEKRGCDKSKSPDGICTKCRQREKIYGLPSPGSEDLRVDAAQLRHGFDASICCQIESNRATMRFIHERHDYNAKSLAPEAGWMARRAKRYDEFDRGERTYVGRYFKE